MQITWLTILLSILSGISISIPLVIALIKTTTRLTMEKNWNQLMSLLTSFIMDAEKIIVDGKTKKDYVIGMLKASQSQLNYEITEKDWASINKLIDEIITMATIINKPKDDNS